MKGSTPNLPPPDYNRLNLERRNTTNTTYSEEKTDIDRKDDIKVHFPVPLTDNSQVDELDFLPLLPSQSHPSPVGSTTSLSLVLSDVGLLLAILFAVIWPWAFLGAVRAKDPGGFEMSPSLHNFYIAHESLFAGFVTLLGTANRILSTSLLGYAIVRYGQAWIAATHKPRGTTGTQLNVFGVSALMGFRHLRLMWGIGDVRTIFKQGRQVWVVLLLLIAVGGSAVIPSATVILLTPIPYDTIVNFTGTELDFASNSSECLAWMRENAPYRACQYLESEGEEYSTCLTEAQMVDMLGAGRSNVSPPDSTELPYPRQLMTGEPVQVSGSSHGVLPIGPHSFIGLRNNTLDQLKVATEDGSIPRKHEFYEYTLSQQGLETDVRCSRDDISPIQYAGTISGLMSIVGFCDPQRGLEPVFSPSTLFTIPDTDNTLAFWACRNISVAAGSDINVYFSGRGDYVGPIGNITCTLSPFQSKEYDARFLFFGHEVGGWWTYSKATLGSDVGTRALLTPFVEGVMLELGNFTSGLQTQSGNMVAETLGMLGVKVFNLPRFPARNDLYLKVLESMVQGVLDYSTTHMRLLYSITPNRPEACTRPIKGTLTYQKFGWHAAPCIVKMHFLVAATLMNLVSLAICIAALIKGRFKYRTGLDPTDARALLKARVSDEGRGDSGWGDVVKFE